MQEKLKIDITTRKIFEYIKITLIALLAVVEIIICADSYWKVVPHYCFWIAFALCLVLLILESLNAFVFKNFAAKMTFYGIDSAIILTICLLTGNSLMSAIYCIVLTQCYI